MSRCVLAVLSITFLSAFGATPACPGDGPHRMPLASTEVPGPHVEWYGLYVNGTKSGYLRQEFGRIGTGDAATYFADQTGHVEVQSMGRKRVMEMSERKEFDVAPPFGFRRGRKSESDGKNTKVTEVVRDASGLSIAVTDGSESFVLKRPVPDYTLADELTSERWFSSPRNEGDTLVVATFGLNKLETSHVTYRVVARHQAVVLGVQTLWYEATRETKLTGDGGRMRMSSTGRLLSIALGGAIEGRLESEEEAKRIEEGADLFLTGMVKIDKPLGDPTSVRRLVVEVDGESASKLMSGPRQSARHEGKTGKVILELGGEAGAKEPATAEDAEDALAETTEYPIRLQNVVELARSAIGDASTVRDKIERLVLFVRQYIADEIRPEALSVSEIIASRRGDCSEHAKLYVVLARAVGIPAREVSGLMYMGDGVRAFGGHAWNEVVLDGAWVSVDATWGQVGVDATHVTLNRSGARQAVREFQPRLSFRLREVEHSTMEAKPEPATTDGPSSARVSADQLAEAKRLEVPVAFENSIGMRFVLVPAGTFMMGSSADEEDRHSGETPHRVTMTRPYYMSVNETTNAQYRRFKEHHDSGKAEAESLNADTQPVVKVNHEDAKAFADWLSQKEPGRSYRLPTEAEWEYAARAGSGASRYWRGGDGAFLRNANVRDLSAKRKLRLEAVETWDDGFAVTAPVGSLLPNAWGLYDVLGNAWEWCADWMEDYPAEDVSDPLGPPKGDTKVLRGGSWMGPQAQARAACRLDSAPDVRYGSYGFRLVVQSGAAR